MTTRLVNTFLLAGAIAALQAVPVRADPQAFDARGTVIGPLFPSFPNQSGIMDLVILKFRKSSTDVDPFTAQLNGTAGFLTNAQFYYLTSSCTGPAYLPAFFTPLIPVAYFDGADFWTPDLASAATIHANSFLRPSGQCVGNGNFSGDVFTAPAFHLGPSRWVPPFTADPR